MNLAKICYRDFFDDFDSVELKKLLEGIPSINILERVSLSNMKLFYEGNNTNTQINIFKLWSLKLPKFIRQRTEYIISRVEVQKNTFCFLDGPSSLLLIDKVLENYADLPRKDVLSNEEELRIFQAYMFCAQAWIIRQEEGYSKFSKENNPFEFILCAQFCMKEFMRNKDSRLQMIKAIYFFKFCESNSIFSNFLKIFLKHVDLDSWQAYLKNIFDFYGFHLINSYIGRGVILSIEEDDGIIGFLDELSVNVSTYQSTSDFSEIRRFPLIKIDTNSYLVLSMIFLVDKLYQGIQFNFAKVLVENKAIHNGKVINNPPQFFGLYGEVSEKFLFYRVIDEAFMKLNCIKISGERFEKYKIDGSPDYYIRNHNNIFVFEFKNTYINSKYKSSTDFVTIKKAILSKFCVDDGKIRVGVPQLINVIKKICDGKFEVLDNYNLNKIKIYPILVYVDPSLDAPGVNLLLNREFILKAHQLELDAKYSIKDVTLININTFIEFQDLYNKKIERLDDSIDNYINMGRKTKSIYDKYSSFSDFLPYSVFKKKIDFTHVVAKLVNENLLTYSNSA